MPEHLLGLSCLHNRASEQLASNQEVAGQIIVTPNHNTNKRSVYFDLPAFRFSGGLKFLTRLYTSYHYQYLSTYTTEIRGYKARS